MEKIEDKTVIVRIDPNKILLTGWFMIREKNGSKKIEPAIANP
jgi:hypothetical protein